MPEDRHDALDPLIDHAARQLAREAEAAVNDHPDVEDLVAYQEGQLADDDAERLRRHLVACSQCARELLELEDFSLDEPADPAFEPSSAETAEDWAAFRHQVAAVSSESPEISRAPAGEETPAPMPMPLPAPRPGPTWWALAAAAVIAVGLGYWIAGLARDGGATSAPLVARHLFELDLLPEGVALSRDAEPAATVPVGTDVLLLRLHLGDQTPHDAYRAEILDATGATVWKRTDLRRQPAGQFLAMVPRAKLPAGRYRLELIAITGGDDTRLATYSFVLRDAPDS